MSWMTLPAGKYKNYPKGRTDMVHLRTEGAEFYADILVKLAKTQKLPLAELFK